MTDIGGLTAPQASCPHPFLGGPQLENVCALNNSTAAFLFTFNTLVALHPKIGDPCGRVEPVKRPRLVYDYVVVGAGAAGPVVAEYLSRSKNTKVLIMEAGPDTPAATEIPSNLQLYLNTELDWKYETTNESHVCLKRGGRCKWPRGKNLGGCTAHHGMAYHRGHRQDYVRWAEMGNEGWSWEEVLPFFMEQEDNQEIGRVDKKYHGTGGPLTVERFPWHPELADDILAAAKETRYGVTEDMVGDQITGFTIAQTISRDGVRLDTSKTYLRSTRNRKNLDVAVNSLVTKIVTKKKKVTGVEYISNGKKGFVRVRKEVIVSGGAVNSPQLLLLSGIGPKAHLESLKIPVVHDLPGVGENLHNHVSFGLDFTMDVPAEDMFGAENAQLYLYNQTGPMSSTGMAQLTAILPSKYTTPDDPDIQIFFAGYQATCDTGARIEDLASNDNKYETVRFTSVNLQSASRGRITLKDKDPMQPPIIWSNELSHPKDIEVIIDGIRAIEAIANSTALKKYGLKLASGPVEACSQYEAYSDDYWRCAIQWDTRPENHQAGSCKMGPASDPMAVVDPSLKVHGIQGLRVADASIMPQVVSGNPVATVNMIGLRAGHFIATENRIKV